MSIADSIITGFTFAVINQIYNRVSNAIFFKHLDAYLDNKLNNKTKLKLNKLNRRIKS